MIRHHAKVPYATIEHFGLIAYAQEHAAKLFHELVEAVSYFTNFIAAVSGQALGQVAVAGGERVHGVAQAPQWASDRAGDIENQGKRGYQDAHINEQ